LGLSAWYLHSRRGVPMLDVDYKEETEYDNRQREQTFRGVLSWDRTRRSYKVGLRGGYAYTESAYDYSRDLGNGTRAQLIRSRSYIHTVYGTANGDYFLDDRWMFSAGVSLHQYLVASRDRSSLTASGEPTTVGYDQARAELSGYVSVRWQPTERLGVAASLREELCGRRWSPAIPAGFIDYRLSRRGNVLLKASVSRNCRFPSLNDLYFLPGGNPDLRREQGFTYDAGVSFALERPGRYALRGEATWFDSRIDDWIVWLPTFNGFWTPRNVRRVHAYGVEVKAGLKLPFAHDWNLELDGNFAWTPSINHGDPVNWADASIGRQLVYIPEYSAALTGRLSWRGWRLVYQWNYYSERYTTSSNEMATKIGRVLPYFMNNLALEKSFAARWAELAAKVQINNLFNEEYESVLSRPMPRLNFEVFLELKPRFGTRRRNGRS
ncbi:MAG: TonB-dependent receptor, partial [Rikenella sp.]|nr:TonB-dependent receptor [Rikenella sp.]